MKTKHLLLSAMMLAAASGIQAQQPYSGCWFPDDIINWSPETDPDAKFNRSRIPLSPRFTEPQLMKAHAGQSYTAYVETATITNKMCSLMPSQGDNNFLGYQPTYWQYLEKFVNWGGAGNEGIFVLPPAGTIDAAHLNGVKILGQLFFMPRTIGGRDSWIEAMLTKVDGKYPYAVKMYEIAKYFGFDGWFINKELDNGKRVSEWADFITCFNETADAAGDTYMEIQWYDAKGNPTIEILKSHKNTSQFLEYNSTGDKSSYASQLGCTAEEILHRLYAGIECVQSGLTGYNSALSSVHKGSIALFCPEQNTYKIHTDPMWTEGKTSGTEAYEAQTKAFQQENLTWVNSNGNPAATGGSWAGVSGYVLERSVIDAMPFATSFAVGNGKHRFVKGQKLNTQDWYNTSVQSILPTWRYWIENQGDMKVAIDWDDAYNLGNSIALTGNLTAGDHLWRLYKTMMPVTSGGKLRLAYKSNGTAPEVKLSTSSSINPDVTLSGAQTSTANGWSVAEYDLSTLNGKTIYMIALNLKGAKNAYELKLGELALLPANYKPAALNVSDFTCNTNLGDNSGDLRLTWSYDYTPDFDRFDIYLTDAKGRRLVGQTRGEGFYIPRFNREGSDKQVKVELVPVMIDGTEQAAHTIDKEWRKAAAPVITITPVKSYAKIGERVVLTATGTDNPTSFAWTLPSTVKLLKGSLNDATIEVSATSEGKQEVTLKVSNAQGTSTFKGAAFEAFTDLGYKEVHNASLEKAIAGMSRATIGEAAYLIDGVTNPNNKDFSWGDISTSPYVTVDLKTPHTIYGFNIYDNHSAFKSGEDNIANYRILVSQDNADWTEVIDKTGTKDENIHTADIVPTVARYVKLVPYADKRFTCRLFEFEIIGRDNSRITVNAPHDIALSPKETQTVTIDYNLNGEQRADNFGLELSTESSFISFTEPQDDNNGHFTFDLTAANRIGAAELTVTLRNGDAKRQTFIDVTLDTDKAVNSLAGMEAEMRKYDADYVKGGTFTSQTTGNLTDGDTTTEGLTEEMYDDPCTSRNDLWAVFRNPDMFFIGKVKVFIPAGNKGFNANDKEGFVNNAVSIRVSNDGTSWTTVRSFNDLQGTSELTCYMPDMPMFTYLAVVCDVNTYFYPSLAEVEAYAQLEDEGPRVMPQEIAEGFTHDIIAENTPIEDYATKDYAWGCFFTSNVRADNSIASPDSRMIVGKDGTPFKLGEYDKPNAMYMDAKNTDFPLTLASPVNAEKLHILCSREFGYQDITLTISYEDGTTDERTIAEDDVPNAEYDSDNIDRFTITGLKVLESDTQTGSGSYGLFDLIVDTDPDKAVTAINFYAAKGSHDFYVFAVSALTDPNASKIILKPEAAKMTVAPGASAEIVVKYDLNGEQRADNFGLTAEASNGCIKLGNPSEDKAASTFTIPVTANDEPGTSVVTLTLTNGENAKQCKVSVSVNVPAEFSGWNKDVIVEALPAQEHATGSVNGDELALFTTDVQEKGAIAGGDRIVTTANGTRFILADYAENNALILESYETLTLTAEQAGNCTEVRILAMSDRACDVDVTATYDDGTSTEPQTLSIAKWDNEEGAAVTGVNFINADGYNSWIYDPDEIDNTDHSLVELSLPLDESKKLTSVSFEQTSSRPTTTILALAKIEKTSGINAIAPDAAGHGDIEAAYNLQGVQVSLPLTPGLYIVRYSDGTTTKVVIR